MNHRPTLCRVLALAMAAFLGSIESRAVAAPIESGAEIRLGRDERSRAIGTEVIGGFFKELLPADAAVDQPETHTLSARRLTAGAGDDQPIRLLAIYAVRSEKTPFIHRDFPIARFSIEDAGSPRPFPKNIQVTVTKTASNRLVVEASDAGKPFRRLVVRKVTPREIAQADMERDARFKETPPIAAIEGAQLKQRVGVRTAGGVFKEMLPAGSTLPMKSEHSIRTSQRGQQTCRLPVYEGTSHVIERCRLLETYAITGLEQKETAQNVQVTFAVDEKGKLDLTARLLGDAKRKLRVETLADHARRIVSEGNAVAVEQPSPKAALPVGTRGAMPVGLFSPTR